MNYQSIATHLIIALATCVPMHADDECSVTITPTWQILDTKNALGGKSVLVGTFTFRKKSKECLKLCTLTLDWKGKQLDKLVGSLYRKKNHPTFIPLEECLVCDGFWSQKKQQLILHFNHDELLNPKTTFYLVLTITDQLEKTIQDGTLLLQVETLPTSFQKSALEQQLLSFNTVNR